MTTAQRITIRKIEEQAEAERWQAAQAAREQALIEESVIIAVQVKIEEGRIEEARQMWLAYKRTKGN